MAADPHDLPPHLRQVADTLDLWPDHDGQRALNGLCYCLDCVAALFSARGFPSSTLGTGSRSSDSTSSTERAAGVTSAGRHPRLPQYATLRDDLVAELRALRTHGDNLLRLLHEVRKHDTMTAAKVAGQGLCHACTRICRPDRNPNDRIKSRYCPACYKAWLGYRQENNSRSDFERWRRIQLKGKEAQAPAALALAPPVSMPYDDGRAPAAKGPAAGHFRWFVLLQREPVAGPYTSEAEAAEAREERPDADACMVGTLWVNAPAEAAGA